MIGKGARGLFGSVKKITKTMVADGGHVDFVFLGFTGRSLLPPASEGWGKVLFSVCLSVHTRGGVPHLRSR